MNSSIIGKIEKAHRYADEPGRAQIRTLSVQFRGDHDVYDVRLEDKQWSCTCHSYGTLGTCSHIMAMERLLVPMIPDDVPVSGHATFAR
ncbi:MAG TPA: SWIM zinc finger family protein [Thermomicrobiaceae bacterium]|nr:SWIM zinc finger family protein [Thermomicrobiaceae bacterium]